MSDPAYFTIAAVLAVVLFVVEWKTDTVARVFAFCDPVDHLSRSFAGTVILIFAAVWPLTLVGVSITAAMAGLGWALGFGKD